MICPHCAVEMHPQNPDRGGMHGATQMWYSSGGQTRRVSAVECPACGGAILLHSDIVYAPVVRGETTATEENIFVLWPRTSGRKPLPVEVLDPYRSLYEEAATVLSDSPRASAVLSRRCLQKMLRDVLHAPAGDLRSEIDWTLNNGNLPPYVTESLHDLRKIGNSGAHPNKSPITGDDLDVEKGEAEWTLDTLDALFGHLFVEPARVAARKSALTAKLSP